jgi:hypothetical protein
LEFLAIPAGNRSKPYTGPRIEDLPKLTKVEKEAMLAVMNTQGVPGEPVESTYPGLTNQDMVNLIFRAAAPFTDDPWRDWIVRANLEFLAVPSSNRSKPYSGPRIEDLPNLTEEEKGALLAEL